MKWEDLPKEIQEKMLDYQKEQSGKKNEDVFKRNIKAGGGGDDERTGGFSWNYTTEGFAFWNDILIHDKIYRFFEKHPKSKEYPKVMLVKENPCDLWSRRVVFAEKRGKYIAWSNAKTFEEAEKEIETCLWSIAKDIPDTIKVTKKEIAEKFNVDPEYLEIVD